jgi:hypothetical protein
MDCACSRMSCEIQLYSILYGAACASSHPSFQSAACTLPACSLKIPHGIQLWGWAWVVGEEVGGLGRRPGNGFTPGMLTYCSMPRGLTTSLVQLTLAFGHLNKNLGEPCVGRTLWFVSNRFAYACLRYGRNSTQASLAGSNRVHPKRPPRCRMPSQPWPCR